MFVCKPAGLAVHGGAGADNRALIDLLQRAYVPPATLHLVHRLDRATSGVMVVAKTAQTARALSKQWDGVTKTYVALAFGDASAVETIDRHLDGRAARTVVVSQAVLRGLEPICTLLEVRIETGRTHQIRRHLSDVGHPVAGDDKYGDFASNRALKATVRAAGLKTPKDGLLLHAHTLTIAQRRVVAPVAEVFRAIAVHGSGGTLPLPALF